MLQEVPPEVGWDIRSIDRFPPASQKFYVLFLFVVAVVALVKLLRVWGKALPFRISGQVGNDSYVRYLRNLAVSLNHWIALTSLGFGIYAGVDLSDTFASVAERKIMGISAASGVLQDLAVAFTMALVVNLFTFLVRWHVVNRIARLQTP